MRLLRILLTIIITIYVTSAIAFAIPNNSPNNTDQQQIIDKTAKFKKQQDSIKILELKKQRINQKLKDGKISKDKAKKLTKKINLKIKEFKKFNKLSTAQKREKLILNFTELINKKVKQGKISQEKAQEIIKNYTEQVNKWNGEGYPNFHKSFFNKKHER